MNSAPRPGRYVAWTAFAAASLLALHPGNAAAVARAPLKELQVRMLAAEPMHERAEKRERREHVRERLRELRRLAREMRRDGRTSLRVGGESARPFVEDEDLRPGRPVPARATAPMSAGAVTGPPRANQRCNDPSSPNTPDGLLDGQCETTIARWNNYVVAAWNDGSGFTDGTNQTQGWATSTNGGVTWVDRGYFPVASGTWVWTSDPVLAVNPTTGAFYFSALADASPSLSAIGVLKGRFTGSSFAWGPVSVARTVPVNSDFLDKEWIAVDPASGRACLSYSEFLNGISRVEFQSADSALTAWAPAQQLSPAGENGAVQGSRPIVGPGGTIYVVYYLIGNVDVDYYRICRSTDGGASFSTPVDAASFYSNFGSGAPGFNRAMGLQFPSVAVDRSGGAHDGRLYLSWAESMNWYDDAAQLGNRGVKAESEPNSTPAQATALAVGQTASGSVNTSSDLYDWYALPLRAGQGILVAADTLASGLSITMRMFATDAATRLCYAEAAAADVSQGFHPPFIFTAPTDGTYYLRIAGLVGGGTYRVATGATARGGERGRDQRDAFVSSSDNGGTSWSAPVRISNSPVGFDDWLPEVAVGADGQVYGAWYDWRDATPSTNGGESSVYLARSSDGGATWAELGATSDAKTAWSAVQSNIIPNQGDYISLFADAGGLSVAWADGRSGNPDVYMSYWTQSEASTLPALVSASAIPGRVDLLWKVGTAQGFAAELYRRAAGTSSAWDSLGTLLSNSAGSLAYADTTAVQGQAYEYRLGVMQGGLEYFYGQVTVSVPRATTGLALAGAWPNPATNASVIAFTLAGNGTARLDLLDLNGRRVLSREVGSLGPGAHTVPLTSGQRLRPGMYFVRLEQAGVTRSRRIVVL